MMSSHDSKSLEVGGVLQEFPQHFSGLAYSSVSNVNHSLAVTFLFTNTAQTII
jgi:hypothetical protein